MAPSWISPRMPRVFTLERTRFRSPTPAARVCISPSPLYTCSSRSLTSRKDWLIRSSRVFCSFSSTVARICSRRRPLSSWRAASRFSTVVRMPSSFSSVWMTKLRSRWSFWASWSWTVRWRRSCRSVSWAVSWASRLSCWAAAWDCPWASSSPVERAAERAAWLFSWRVLPSWAAISWRSWSSSSSRRASSLEEEAGRRSRRTRTAISNSRMQPQRAARRYSMGGLL